MAVRYFNVQGIRVEPGHQGIKYYELVPDAFDTQNKQPRRCQWLRIKSEGRTNRN